MTASLINPLQSAKARFVCSAVVFLIALALYALTLAPTVTLVDSGELIVAAREPGVAHPPGFPLYILLTHLITLVPIGSVAARTNFASAIFAALAAFMLSLLVIEAMLIASTQSSGNIKSSKKSGKGKKAKKQSAPKMPQIEPLPDGAIKWIIAYLPSVVAGLLFAFGRTLWGYATITEVYTLNALLILTIFLLMFYWRRINRTPEVKNSKTQDKPLYIAAFIFGLALGVHHVTVGLMIFALAFLVYSVEGIKFFAGKRLLYAALAALAGLTIYAYLPMAASRGPAMNWGDPRTFERLWWHITGAQYQVFFSPSLKMMFKQVPEFFRLLFREFGPWWMPIGLSLALTGFVAAFKFDRTLFWFLILIIAGDLIYALNYEIAEDKDAYYLPTFIAMAIAAGIGAQWLFRSVRQKTSLYIGAGLFLIIPAVALAANLAFNNRSNYFIARDYVENVFETIEPNGMLLTGDWQLYSPMFYLREIERKRTDVIAIDTNLLRRSWYYDYLKSAYPELIASTRDKVDAFLEDLRAWDEDPDLYMRDINLNQRINTRFRDMIIALVSKHMETGAVYLAPGVAGGLDPKDADWQGALNSTYQMVPQGLVYQLVTDRAFHEVAEPKLETRGLVDGAIKFEDDDTVNVKVLPVYTTMLAERGAYLAKYNFHDRAVEAFKKALEFSPGNPRIQQALDQSVSASKKGIQN